MCSQFNPNPHELEFGEDFLALAAVPLVRNTTTPTASVGKQRVRSRLKQFMRSTRVRRLSPAQRTTLAQKAAAHLSRMR